MIVGCLASLMRTCWKTLGLPQTATVSVRDLWLGKELATGTSSSGPQLTRMQNFCINASFGVNVTLVVIKLIAAIVSASIVVVASALDSALDILFVSWLCRRGRGRVLTSLR